MMNDSQIKQSNMIESSDCLEAIGVFRRWKNFLCVIVALCLVSLQIVFWLADSGLIKSKCETKTVQMLAAPVVPEKPNVLPPPAKDLVTPLGDSESEQVLTESEDIEEAAKMAVGSTDTEEKAEKPSQAESFLGINLQHIVLIVRFCNFVLILAAAMYCLTLLFSLKISLVGRLGGINHICRAFFLSLVMFVLLLPWQCYFRGVVVGAMYTPGELAKVCSFETDSILRLVVHYLRFSGYWLIILWLLILSQLRSSRWTKAILRRLEII